MKKTTIFFRRLSFLIGVAGFELATQHKNTERKGFALPTFPWSSRSQAKVKQACEAYFFAKKVKKYLTYDIRQTASRGFCKLFSYSVAGEKKVKKFFSHISTDGNEQPNMKAHNPPLLVAPAEKHTNKRLRDERQPDAREQRAGVNNNRSQQILPNGALVK